MTVIGRYVVEIDGDVLGREGDVPSAEQVWAALEMAFGNTIRVRDADDGGAVEALREIVAADPIDLALDPNWPQRIAAKALQTLDPPSAGGQ